MPVTTRNDEKLIPTAVTTLHGVPSWWPARKVWMGGGAAIATIVGITLLNEFVLSPANQIPIWGLIMPLVPVVVSYASKPAAAEGTKP